MCYNLFVIFSLNFKKNMKMKKYLKHGFSALTLAIIGLTLSARSASALCASVAANNNGDSSLIVGTDGTCNPVSTTGGGWALSNPYGLPGGSILGIASSLLFWLLSIFAIAGIIGFIISGIFYLVAAGDEKTVEKGKTGLKYSIIGIIVGLSGFLIMQAVSMFLSGSSSSF